MTSVDGYETLGMAILERGEYGFIPGISSAAREPAYPLLIAAVYGLAGGRHPWGVLALQCVLGAATVAMIWALARRLFSGRMALFCAWTGALYPAAIYYSAYFFRETLILFLVTALSWLSTSWSEPKRPGVWPRVLWSGLAAAAAALGNAALLPAVVLAGVGLWLVAPKSARTGRLLLYLAPVVAAGFVWTARNWRAFGAFVPGSTHGGEEFYQALIIPPDELGTPAQARIVSEDPNLMEASRLPEVQANACRLHAAGAFIGRHPGLYARRVGARLVKFWRLYPYHRLYNVPYGVVVLAALLSDGWIVLLGLAGCWIFRRRWAEAAAMPAVLIGTTTVYAAIHAVIRYRLPLMGVMIVLAGGAAAELRRRFLLFFPRER